MSEEIYLSAKELGTYIGKPVRTIENWAAARNIKQNPEGKYGLVSAFKYQLATVEEKLEKTELHLEEARAGEGERRKIAVERKAIAEADKEEALAEIKQLELLKLKGELVDAVEVLDTWKSAIAKTKAKFISIPAKLALELFGLDKPTDIQARLTQVIDEALAELGDASE
jgi:hypothetical protein